MAFAMLHVCNQRGDGCTAVVAAEGLRQNSGDVGRDCMRLPKHIPTT